MRSKTFKGHKNKFSFFYYLWTIIQVLVLKRPVVTNLVPMQEYDVFGVIVVWEVLRLYSLASILTQIILNIWFSVFKLLFHVNLRRISTHFVDEVHNWAPQNLRKPVWLKYMHCVFTNIRRHQLFVCLISIISNFDVYASINNWVLGSSRQRNSQ